MNSFVHDLSVTRGFVHDFEHFLRMYKRSANNTAVRYLRYLKNVMQYAIANKWATEGPFLGKRFKRTVAEREGLTREFDSMVAVGLRARVQGQMYGYITGI